MQELLERPAESPAKPAEIDTSMISGSRMRVDVEAVCQGMFVAELDRPWLDTPFMLQGFLVANDRQIDALRAHCRYVIVDLEKSSHEFVRRTGWTAETEKPKRRGHGRGRRSRRPALPARMLQALVDLLMSPFTGLASLLGGTSGAPRSRHGRASAAGSAGVRGARAVHGAERARAARSVLRMSQGIRPERTPGLMERVKEAVGVTPSGAADKSHQRLTVSAAVLPPGVVPERYEDARTLEQELPRAQAAVERSQQVVHQLLADIGRGNAPDQAQLQSTVTELVDSIADNPDALLWAARLRAEDEGVYNHGMRVSLYLLAMGRHIGLPKPELRHLAVIGLLADVGKTRLPKAVLDKPGMLDEAEFEAVRSHVEQGLKLLKTGIELSPEVELGIRHHHERLDGSGYPGRLAGDSISLYGRMAAIADTFVAMTTARSYANAMAPMDAMLTLYQCAGAQFHEPLIEQFVHAIGAFPVGSMVELSNGEVGIVLVHNRVRRLEPRLLILTDPDKTPLAEPFERDLFAVNRKAAREARIRIRKGLPTGAYGLRMREYYIDQVAAADPGLH